MALVTRLQAAQKQDTTNDITRNLQSLQFESALTDEEKQFLDLRARNHAISVTQCAVTTVMVDIFMKARDMKMNLVYPERKKTTQLLQNEEEKDTLIVGIIGCGRLGSQIAHCLLTYGQLHPSKLQISTRRPETLEYLQSKGVECYFNNERLISSVHVVIFCVLPSQMPGVAEEAKDYISSSLIMICPFSSLSLCRLRQMLGSSNVIRPVLHWSEESPRTDYEYSVNVNTALENKDVLLSTCPIGMEDKSSLVVSTDQRLFETMILAVVNMCTDQGLTHDQTFSVIRAAVFGETYKKPLTCDPLTLDHFGLKDQKGPGKTFPFYDLVDAHEKGTPVLKRLLENESIQTTFVARYCHLFEDYVHKRAYGHIS